MGTKELYDLYVSHPLVTTDTRQCVEGALFFALRGERFDGNQYAAKALEAGCAAAVVDDASVAVEGDSRYVVVDDVLTSLQQLAAYRRRQLHIPVIQVTGTNGKTTTKELIAAVLARRYRVRFTQGNLNNHIGVPLTLLSIADSDEIAVVETGANHPGEIAFLCSMVQADCGLITNVGRAHLEGFGSFDGVKHTKGELYDDLAARGAFAFLNEDDHDLCVMAQERGVRTMAYVAGEVLRCSPFLECRVGGREIRTRLIGAYNIANVRAAVTVGLHFGVDMDDIVAALEDYEPRLGRSQYVETGRNRLIVDAYNANPTSMQLALDNFREMGAEGRMVILGAMGELGEDSVKLHQEVAGKIDCEAWLVGREWSFVSTSEGLPVRRFDSVDDVVREVEAQPLKDRTILVKGSHSTRLYELPKHL